MPTWRDHIRKVGEQVLRGIIASWEQVPREQWDQMAVVCVEGCKQQLEDPNELYAVGTDWLCGVCCPPEDWEHGDDYKRFKDFNSWGVENATRITKEPPLVTVEESKELLGKRYELDFIGCGQPDGPGSSGCLFAARVWDVCKHREVPGSRVIGDDPDWVASAAHLAI